MILLPIKTNYINIRTVEILSEIWLHEVRITDITYKSDI